MTTSRIATAVASLAPLAMFILDSIVSPFREIDSNPDQLMTIWDLYPGVFGKLTLISLLWGMVFAFATAYRVFRRQIDVPNRRGLWVFLLVAANVIILPAFWYLYLRNSTKSVAA